MKTSLYSWQLRRLANTRLPTLWGEFQSYGFMREEHGGAGRRQTAIVLVLGTLAGNIPLLRIHSQCLTGEVLRSLRCDCGEQLELAMQAIAKEGCGLLIYENQEGRGIGLMAKLQAYELQDAGLDTVAANHALGLQTDYRDFGMAVAILDHLGVQRVRLLTNNLEKSDALRRGGIQVVERLPCEAAPNAYSLPYLRTKKEKMNHLLTLGSAEANSASKDIGRTRYAPIAVTEFLQKE